MEVAGPASPPNALYGNVGQATTLKVWLGFVKVNRKLPTIDSFHGLLYGDMACSILKCDVIALYLTDVFS